MSKAKICVQCNTKQKSDDILDSGYCGWSLNHSLDECPFCHEKLKETNIEENEFDLFLKISRSATFYDTMIELKKKDPIEFQLKMSQFRNQVKQQEAVELQNIPHCPICNSTDIKKISGISKAKSVAVWGIFSRKVHKQWHCEQCGSEF